MSPDKPAGRPSSSGKGAGKPGASKPGAAKPAAKGAAGKPGAQPRRMSREAALALVLMPVLLVAGFVLGGQLLSDDEGAVLDTAAPATSEPSAEPTSSAAAETSAPIAGPVVTEEPTPSETATTEPTPEPTVEPTTEAPTPEPTTAAPTPEPTTAAPSPEPTTAPAAPPAPPAPAPAPPTETTTATAAPPLSNPAVDTFGPGQVSEDIRNWQARMAERGWTITADGIYGQQTASVAARFQAEKGLAVDGLVGPATYAAAWELPVT